MLRDKVVNKMSNESQRKIQEKGIDLSVEELEHAETEILKHVQNDSFHEEIKELKANRVVNRSSGRRKLDPIITDGLLCVGGRLKNANSTNICKNPIILPKDHHVVTLIIRDCHERAGHTGAEHVLSLTRDRYWIVQGRRAVQKTLNCCLTCRKKYATPGRVKMGDLPEERVNPGDPGGRLFWAISR